MTRIFIVILILFLSLPSYSQYKRPEATWIWYPHDFEIWLHREISQRREKNSHIFPPFWPLDTHYGNLKFYKEYDMPAKDTIALGVTSEEYALLIDNIWQYDFDPNAVPIPAGKHSLSLIVVDYQQLPSVYVKGNHVVTDDSWMVSRYDNNDQKAASWNFNSITSPPTKYRLATKNIQPVERSTVDQQSVLYDFGKESYGYVRLQNWQGKGNVSFYYGESKPEALAREKSLQFNHCKRRQPLCFKGLYGMVRH